MKLPVGWLREYVEFEDSLKRVADKLTFAGFEVESIETAGCGFAGVQVGEVTRIEPHPDKVQLWLCTVEYGAEEVARVACGAPNMAAGGKYPFLAAGTSLPDEMLRKKAKVGSKASTGILCSKGDLGLGEDHSALLVLPADVRPGTPLAEVWGKPETVIEVEVTPNRPDCLSIIGVAREMAVLYGIELRLPEVEFQESSAAVEEAVAVGVDDAALCSRYTVCMLEGATIAPSPQWMQERLTASGIRPINNVVDATNYVLLETGHPLHAFDRRGVAGNRIQVRHAADGEKITTLDRVERTLAADMLVIADSRKALAIAGVMGGAQSEIKDDTTTILLEAACFEPVSIGSTAKQLGLITDSSYRFQRRVNVDSVSWAGRRAAGLICEISGAVLRGGVVDAYPQPPETVRIPFVWQRINALIGTDLSVDVMKGILDRLSIRIEGDNGKTATARIPSFRMDIDRDIDLVEEVARVYGVNHIPAHPPLTRVVSGNSDARPRSISALRSRLQGLGVSEIMNYTLVGHPLLDLFNTENRTEREELPHPVSEDQSVLRPSLIPQLVESLGRNRARQVDAACFYEMGQVFKRVSETPVQEEVVSLGMMGPVGRMPLSRRPAVSDEEMFVWVKGLVEQLLAARPLDHATFQAADRPEFASGQCVQVERGGKTIGVLGLVKKSACDRWRLSQPLAAAELSLNALLAEAFTIRSTEYPAVFPSMTRDIALVLDESITHADVVVAVEKANPKDMESFTMFDAYKGVKAGKKSIAYSFIYRSAMRTLTDSEVNKTHRNLTRFLCEQLGACVRN